jgi:hypothetical protein
MTKDINTAIVVLNDLDGAFVVAGCIICVTPCVQDGDLTRSKVCIKSWSHGEVDFLLSPLSPKELHKRINLALGKLND